MIKLFFVYSHRDEEMRNELEKHLHPLLTQGLIAAWHDRRIAPGEPWEARIENEMDQADIILLLVSPDFLASDYCQSVELKAALAKRREGSARVIPVILRPCDWNQPPLSELQALPRDGKPVTKHSNLDEAFLEIARGIRRVVQELDQKPVDTAAPEPGPALPVANVNGIDAARPVRSSNLRVRKEFSEREKHQFRDHTFEYIANYFENSITELGRRNDGLEGSVKRIDAVSLDAVLYRDGRRVAGCQIYIDRQGLFGGDGICYSAGNLLNGISEQLIVHDDGYTLFMRPLFGSTYGGNWEVALTQEGAAELLWSRFMEPLQR